MTNPSPLRENLIVFVEFESVSVFQEAGGTEHVGVGSLEFSLIVEVKLVHKVPEIVLQLGPQVVDVQLVYAVFEFLGGCGFSVDEGDYLLLLLRRQRIHPLHNLPLFLESEPQDLLTLILQILVHNIVKIEFLLQSLFYARYGCRMVLIGAPRLIFFVFPQNHILQPPHLLLKKAQKRIDALLEVLLGICGVQDDVEFVNNHEPYIFYELVGVLVFRTRFEVYLEQAQGCESVF